MLPSARFCCRAAARVTGWSHGELDLFSLRMKGPRRGSGRLAHIRKSAARHLKGRDRCARRDKGRNDASAGIKRALGAASVSTPRQTHQRHAVLLCVRDRSRSSRCNDKFHVKFVDIESFKIASFGRLMEKANAMLRAVSPGVPEGNVISN